MSAQQKTSSQKLVTRLSAVVYGAAIVAMAILLISEPGWFDARLFIVPFLSVLFVSALGIGYRLTSDSPSKAIRLSGVLALATLLTFVGFFIIAAVAWFVGLSHA